MLLLIYWGISQQVCTNLLNAKLQIKKTREFRKNVQILQQSLYAHMKFQMIQQSDISQNWNGKTFFYI